VLLHKLLLLPLLLLPLVGPIKEKTARCSAPYPRGVMPVGWFSVTTTAGTGAMHPLEHRT
jgi:hypothetical protein